MMDERYTAALAQLIQPTRAVDYARAADANVERMRALLHALGDPHHQYDCIVVAGSVGKTSLCHQLAHGERLAGRRVGLYTSPHLHSFRERFQIDGALIPMDEFAALWDEIARAITTLGAAFSTFEAATALGLHWFARRRIAIAVLEIGLGGRFDAVNVVRKSAAAITPIEWEHAAILGGTLERIAWHKAGVIPAGGRVYSAPQAPSVTAVIAAEAARVGAVVQPLAVLTRDLPPPPPIPGRMERAPNGIWIDGAHTVGGARRIVEMSRRGVPLERPPLERLPLESDFEMPSPVTIVIGMLRDKAIPDVLAAFDHPHWHWILTTAPATRGLSASELAAGYAPTHARTTILPDVEAALAGAAALRQAYPAQTVIVAGSLRMAAAAREFFGMVTADMVEEARATRAIYAAKNAGL
jgi:dihydrofolate synthase/folylpolyglutamate synthase